MRTIHPDTLAALSQPHVRFQVLVRFHLDSGVLAWHTGFADLSFDGYTYEGAGTIGSLSNLSEAAELKPGTMTLTLSGIDSAVVSAFTTQPLVNRPAVVHVAVVDDALAVIGEPFLLFFGYLDVIDVVTGSTASLRIPIRSRLSDWERPLVSRFTHEDQQLRYPGDLGFEFVEQLSTAEIEWPGKGFSG